MHTRLPVDGRSAAAARRLLRETLSPHGGHLESGSREDAAETAALLVSELVSNAIVAARVLLLVEITVRGTTLRVAVADDGPGTPTIRPEDHGSAHGRGLRIVDSLADRWGVTPGRDHKTVWFELELPPAAQAGRRFPAQDGRTPGSA